MQYWLQQIRAGLVHRTACNQWVLHRFKHRPTARGLGVKDVRTEVRAWEKVFRAPACGACETREMAQLQTPSSNRSWDEPQVRRSTGWDTANILNLTSDVLTHLNVPNLLMPVAVGFRTQTDRSYKQTLPKPLTDAASREVSNPVVTL